MKRMYQKLSKSGSLLSSVWTVQMRKEILLERSLRVHTTGTRKDFITSRNLNE